MEYQKLQQIIAQVLHLDIAEITDDADLVSDLGGDSLEIYQIITGIEAEFDISIPDTTLKTDRTVGGLYQLISQVK